MQLAIQDFGSAFYVQPFERVLYCAFSATVSSSWRYSVEKSSARDNLISEMSQFATAGCSRYPALT